MTERNTQRTATDMTNNPTNMPETGEPRHANQSPSPTRPPTLGEPVDTSQVPDEMVPAASAAGTAPVPDAHATNDPTDLHDGGSSESTNERAGCDRGEDSTFDPADSRFDHQRLGDEGPT